MGMCGMLKVLTDEEYSLLSASPNEIEAVLFPEDVDDPFQGQFDLDKCWHELHFLLIGTLEPNGEVLGDAVLGGVEIGPDLGYGQARLISREQVKTIHMALSDIEFDALISNYDKHSALISAVYAEDGLRGDAIYLRNRFKVLCEAYRSAASNNAGMLAYLA